MYGKNTAIILSILYKMIKSSSSLITISLDGLFEWMLYNPVNSFSVISGHFLGRT